MGITRAQQELHLSLARYRDFRGQQRMTVPSQFLMDLPNEELEISEPLWAVDRAAQKAEHGDAWEDATHHDDVPTFDVSEPNVRQPFQADVNNPKIASDIVRLESLTYQSTPAPAATLPGVSPEVFRQDMLVRHPEYGLGKIVTLSGSGTRRSATVNFASSAGQKKFLLAMSPLRPAKE